jgi:hypothetical protein
MFAMTGRLYCNLGMQRGRGTNQYCVYIVSGEKVPIISITMRNVKTLPGARNPFLVDIRNGDNLCAFNAFGWRFWFRPIFPQKTPYELTSGLNYPVAEHRALLRFLPAPITLDQWKMLIVGDFTAANDSNSDRVHSSFLLRFPTQVALFGPH